jgi:hypothetical protein
MADAQPEVRNYNTSDDDMRQRQRTLRQHYLDYAKDFEKFNPAVFTADFAERWEKAQDAAETAEPGTVRAGTLKENTQEVEAEMQKARQLVQRLFYTVGQAWPKNAGRLNQYGKNRYERDRDNHDGMITLLDLAHDAASRPADAVELAKHGWTTTDTALLDTQGEALATANTTQEGQKGSGVEQGQGYVGRQNTLYRFGQQTSLGSKTLYVDDFGKRQLFDLSAPDGDDDEDHELTVPPGQQKAVLFTTPFGDGTRLRLVLSKPQPGMQAEVGRVEKPGAAPTAFRTLTPEKRSRDEQAADLGPAGQYLLVRNVGPQAVRVVLRVLEE